MFADHLLVVWEHCVSVFSVPHVPADGQVVVEPKRVFMLQEAISRPIGFTTCVARRVVPLHRHPNADPDQDAGWDADWEWNGQRKRCPSSALGVSPTLTIAARSIRRADSVSMVMLVPLVDDEDRKEGVAADADTFPYRLMCLPPHLPVTWRAGNQGGGGGVGDLVPPRGCTTLCLGSSGRGVFVVGRELRLVSPGLLILPPYEMEFGPVFETGEALYLVDQHRQRDLDRMNLSEDARTNAWVGAAEEDSASGDKVDFDEGMGRFVVAKESGGFEVIQLD